MTGNGEPAAAGGADEASECVYAYQPSLLGGGWTFRLTGFGIAWAAGNKSGHVPYGAVRRVRMTYKPASMQMHRFVTEIWAEGAPRLQIVSTSWKSMVEQQRLDGPYRAFVHQLHRRLAAAGTSVEYVRGRSPFSYWPGLVLYLAVAFGLTATALRALQAHTLGAGAFVAAFLALFIWQGGNFFRRNLPGRYTPDALPAALMPNG